MASSPASSGYAHYVAGRLAQAVFVVFAAYTASYLILWSLPGDIIANITGGEATDLAPEQIAEIRADWGLDLPLIVRYFGSLGGALTGDFGRSFTSSRPVTDLIGESLPATVQIASLGFVFAILAGAAVALAATGARSRWLSDLLLALPPLAVAVPAFWLGLLLIQAFSFALPIFPATGNVGFASLVLPGITLGIPTSAVVAQLLAQGLSRALAEPYADTARAKGASPLRVQLRHGLRNAAIPALTVSGSVITETVFSRTGLGRLTAQAVAAQDLPVVQGVVVFAAVVFASVNLIVDMVYPALDPRIITAPRRRPALKVA
jgi:peptide/nickel transport system permease protein